MNKNLIKIKGIYTPLEDSEKFNIFCEIVINFNTCEINIKNCEVNQEEENNQVNFDSFNYFYNNLINFNSPKIKERFKKYNNILENTLKIINNIIEDPDFYEGEIDVYLEYLTNFIFQFIYNEIYATGNITFSNIKLV